MAGETVQGEPGSGQEQRGDCEGHQEAVLCKSREKIGSRVQNLTTRWWQPIILTL